MDVGYLAYPDLLRRHRINLVRRPDGPQLINRLVSEGVLEMIGKPGSVANYNLALAHRSEPSIILPVNTEFELLEISYPMRFHYACTRLRIYAIPGIPRRLWKTPQQVTFRAIDSETLLELPRSFSTFPIGEIPIVPVPSRFDLEV